MTVRHKLVQGAQARVTAEPSFDNRWCGSLPAVTECRFSFRQPAGIESAPDDAL